MPDLKYWKNKLGRDAYEQLEKKTGNRNPCPTSNKKRNTFSPICAAILAGKKIPRFNGRISCRIVTVRKVVPRDARAIWEKAVLDSLVSCGVLPDDNTQIIAEKDLSVECICGEPEITRIEIEEL